MPVLSHKIYYFWALIRGIIAKWIESVVNSLYDTNFVIVVIKITIKSMTKSTCMGFMLGLRLIHIPLHPFSPSRSRHDSPLSFLRWSQWFISETCKITNIINKNPQKFRKHHMLIQFGIYNLNQEQYGSDYKILTTSVVQRKKLWPQHW